MVHFLHNLLLQDCCLDLVVIDDVVLTHDLHGVVHPFIVFLLDEEDLAKGSTLQFPQNMEVFQRNFRFLLFNLLLVSLLIFFVIGSGFSRGIVQLSVFNQEDLLVVNRQIMVEITFINVLCVQNEVIVTHFRLPNFLSHTTTRLLNLLHDLVGIGGINLALLHFFRFIDLPGLLPLYHLLDSYQTRTRNLILALLQFLQMLRVLVVDVLVSYAEALWNFDTLFLLRCHSFGDGHALFNFNWVTDDGRPFFKNLTKPPALFDDCLIPFDSEIDPVVV